MKSKRAIDIVVGESSGDHDDDLSNKHSNFSGEATVSGEKAVAEHEEGEDIAAGAEISIGSRGAMNKNQRRRGWGPVCLAAPFTAQNLQWISTISSAVLMFAKGTAIPKSFLVPLFALQAPASLISWIKGEYGVWTAFLALLVRLFFYIPGELELPFIALLMIIVAPYQVMNLRRTQEGLIVSLVIAGYLAFQHFSRAGSLQKAFDLGSIIATLAIVCVVAVPCLLLKE
ncbi:hypothetical protein RJ640_012797 [Escallonia rubra]|uniref:Uncharacterized protein n=1 Tax=Escallonia rubra TaxID=112253 RepID=A0AA88S0L7_9ASTE|nr:hypothetical protein RJ640_012797 [Escallonia rubra]